MQTQTVTLCASRHNEHSAGVSSELRGRVTHSDADAGVATKSGGAVTAASLAQAVRAHVLAALWPPLTLAIYLAIGTWKFGVLIKMSVAFGEELRSRNFDADSILLACQLLEVLYEWLVSFLCTVMGATMIDFFAQVVFAEVPAFNAAERQKQPLAHRARVRFHLEYLWNTFFIQIVRALPKLVSLCSRRAAVATPASASVDDVPVSGDPLIDCFLAGAMPPSWKGVNACPGPVSEILWPGTGSVVADYVVVLVLVQGTLLLSDIFYWCWHVVQHKVTLLYRWTGHSYHHQFRFPTGSAGPWLSALDIVLSGVTGFILPAILAVDAANHFGLCRCRAAWETVCILYVHEMNHFAHCGKQLPLWSGCPLLPPLGFALKLDDGIACHEAHHNFGNCGFGLLGVVDRLAGTARYPSGHPKYCERKRAD